MNPAEHGDMIADMAIEEILAQKEAWARRLMVSRLLRALEAADLYNPPKPFIPEALTPMGEAEAKVFGESGIPFGMYVGTRIKDIPRDYLCVLVDPTQWNGCLRRWLRRN